MARPRLIEPFVARRVARRIAGDPHPGSYLMDRLERDLAEAIPRSEEIVAKLTRIPPPPPVKWQVIDRATWAENNIRSMQEMLGPVAERFGDSLTKAPLPARIAQRTIVSIEVGALLGYISRRVLGQYDLLFGGLGAAKAGGDDDGAMLYLVGPNMVETERTFGFVPEDFALWVSVHEITHRFQFAGVPWLRDRFFALMEEYLATADLDAGRLASRLKEAARRVTDRSLSADEKSPIYLLATEEQRDVMNRIQALMSVVEGHGNFIMDAVGDAAIPSVRRMRHVFEGRRRQMTIAQKAFSYALGLEMKMRQYEIGRAFCDRVASTGGLDAVAHIWTSEETFPSMDELRQPELWIERVA